MNKKQKHTLIRLIVGFALYAVALLLPIDSWFPHPQSLYIELVVFLVPYLVVGYDVLLRAARNIVNGQIFDENFLMSIATLGAFALVLFPDTEQHFSEGAAVMLFYQVGELFQSYAVGKSRQSIKEMMDIAPEFANIEQDGELVQVDPYEVGVGDTIIVKPGERIPLDGIILEGKSQLDTAALTGESMPRSVADGDEVISGCVNLSGKITVRVTRPFEDSTVSRILELVENASEKKARTENFITRFARYYTPAVVIVAALLAVIPPLLLWQPWADWIQRALVFLVVSCPCALVISVPLSFFGGIGGASRLGILVKGGNYLEALAHAETVVFDKTGTLTNGTFSVVAVHGQQGVDSQKLLSYAAHAEAYSDHPIALSIREAYLGTIDPARIGETEEISGHGIRTYVDKEPVYVGNAKLLSEANIPVEDCELVGTILHVASGSHYLGHIVIADQVKPDAKEAIESLHRVGVSHTVMLTGDRRDVAAAVAAELGLDEFVAECLPQDKVEKVEELMATSDSGKGKLAFVGDGINDAPVLTRADIGIAMGALGSDAAIEAADVVLMDDKPTRIATAISLARKTMRIVWQNIVFALGVKFAVLVLAVVGIATMWLAVFADVGVAILAILNAMRCMHFKE